MLFTNFLKPVPKKLHSYKIFISVDCSVSARSGVFYLQILFFLFWLLNPHQYLLGKLLHIWGSKLNALKSMPSLSLVFCGNFFLASSSLYFCISKLIEQIFCWIDLTCQSNPLNHKTNFLIKLLKCITNVSMFS